MGTERLLEHADFMNPEPLMPKVAARSSSAAVAIAVIGSCIGAPLFSLAILQPSAFLSFAAVCWLWWGLVPWALLFPFMAARGRVVLGVWVSFPIVGILVLASMVSVG